jgi:hypothetical protein
MHPRGGLYKAKDNLEKEGCTGKRILERLGIQTSSLFVKIGWICISEFKAIFFSFLPFIWLGNLSRTFWRLLDQDLMASI